MAAAAAGAAHEGSARRNRAYARPELEALRGALSEEAQVRLWANVRAALAAAGFSGEYDGLLVAEDEEPRSRRGSKGRKAAGGGGAGAGRKWGEETAAAAAAPRLSGVLEIGAWRNGDLGVSHEHCFEAGAHDPGVAYGLVEEQGEDVECEDDIDDDYEGILKPAFAVDGDPDFESGEPLDGFEYLRRVSSCLSYKMW